MQICKGCALSSRLLEFCFFGVRLGYVRFDRDDAIVSFITECPAFWEGVSLCCRFFGFLSTRGRRGRSEVWSGLVDKPPHQKAWRLPHWCHPYHSMVLSTLCPSRTMWISHSCLHLGMRVGSMYLRKMMGNPDYWCISSVLVGQTAICIVMCYITVSHRLSSPGPLILACPNHSSSTPLRT